MRPLLVLITLLLFGCNHIQTSSPSVAQSERTAKQPGELEHWMLGCFSLTHELTRSNVARLPLAIELTSDVKRESSPDLPRLYVLHNLDEKGARQQHPEHIGRMSSWRPNEKTLQITLSNGLFGWTLEVSQSGKGLIGVARSFSDVASEQVQNVEVQFNRISCDGTNSNRK
jgi:hypothetical protein